MRTCLKKHVKIVQTLALYLAFFALGLCAAIPGPTLLDLQQITNTDTSRIAFIYLARSSGYLLGSLVGGIVFDIVQRKQLLLVLCNLLMAITSFATPWCRSIECLISVLALGGLSLGALDTGANVLCLSIWGKDSAPYFQALHFLFGLGAFLAPLIAQPFLSVDCGRNALNASHPNDEFSIEPNQTLNISLSNISCPDYTIPPITYSYSIIGSYCLFVTFFFIVLSVICPCDSKTQSDANYESKQKHSMIYIILVAILAQLVLSVYAGIEIGYGQMIAIFAVKGNLRLTKSIASFITALYWGTFTFSRGLSIYMSYKFSACRLVFGDLLIISTGCFLLLMYGSTNLELLLVGTFLLALGLASFYPAVISWVERYINVNNKIASLFVISGCLGEMIIPLSVSQFMESNPNALMEIIFICILCVIVGTLILWQVTCRKGEKYLVTDTAVHYDCEDEQVNT